MTMLMTSDACQRLMFRIILTWHTAFKFELSSALVEALVEADLGLGALQCTPLLGFVLSFHFIKF